MSKGITTCNRTACQVDLVDGAVYYNYSTNANYCPHCAYLINKHNPDLCKLQPFRLVTHDLIAQQREANRLLKILKDMHPEDGLSSPRDINLAHEINRFASYRDAVLKNFGLK